MSERYEITSLIEEDELGSLHLAYDSVLERQVVYRKFQSNRVTAETKKGKRRLKEYSELTGRLCALQHPNLLTIYDASPYQLDAYIVNQHTDAQSLADVLELGPLSQEEVYNMAGDLLDALHAADKSELYHGAWRIGSVKRIDRMRGGHRYLIIDLGLERISKMVCDAEVVMADPSFKAPELLGSDEDANALSDLFSLGQLCYVTMAGGHPFSGKSVDECVAAYKNDGMPHLHQFAPSVQEDFANWVMWLLSPNPQDRPESMQVAMASFHAIEMRAPVARVSDLTQSIQASVNTGPQLLTGAPSLQPSTQTQTQAVNVAVANSNPVVTSSGLPKETKMIIAAVVVIVVLIVALGIHLLVRDDGPSQQAPVAKSVAVEPIKKKEVKELVVSEVEADSASTTEPKESLESPSSEMVAKLVEVVMINSIKKRKAPVIVDFDAIETLDWLVASHSNLTNRRSNKKKANYLHDIIQNGDFSHGKFSGCPIRIKAMGQEYEPQSIADGHRGAMVGDGWEMMVNVPADHQGGLVVTYYVLQWNCDLDFVVAGASSKERLSVPQTTPGIFKVSIELENVRPGKTYPIMMKSMSSSDTSGFGMAICGVTVEKN